MALGSAQPLAEMSTRCISWGKGGRCLGMTTLPPSCAVVMNSGNLNFLEPSGPLQACNGSGLTYRSYIFISSNMYCVKSAKHKLTYVYLMMIMWLAETSSSEIHRHGSTCDERVWWRLFKHYLRSKTVHVQDVKVYRGKKTYSSTYS